MPITAALPSKSPYYGTGKSAPIKNNGGTLFNGGTIASTNLSSMVGPTYLGYRSGMYEAKPYINATAMNYGVIAGLSTGVFGSMTKGKYIMLTFTSQIAGVANTLLNSPSSYGQRGGQNPWIGTFRTQQYIMGGGWDYTTGLPKIKAGLGNQMPSTQDSPVYAVPEQYPGTRAIPGRLFYIGAGLAKDGVPTAANYKAKTD